MDSIRKYVGGDAIQPKINKLGSKDWEKTKSKVKKNLREVAKDLIELYAKREKALGYCFGKDTPWQNEFEGKFPYQETEDQLRCIEEVKKIWKVKDQWIDYFAVMLVMAKQKLQLEQHLKPQWMESK